MKQAAAHARGFTLLEVVIALAILSLALMAIFDMNAGALRMHTYTKRLSVASILARSKMTDIEQDLYDKGFNPDDEDDGGDFSEEGWPMFKWRVKILAPRIDGVSPEQVMGAILGVPMGLPGDDKTGSGGAGALGSLFGGLGGLLGGADKSATAAGGADPLAALAGGITSSGAGGGGILAALGPLAGTQFQQMVDQISKMVREVHLTVSWKEGKQVETLDLVTHVVSAGPGSDRNGSASAVAAGAQPGGGWVDTKTGQPFTGTPQPGPNGTLIDPATGDPLAPAGQAQAGQLPGVPGMPGAPGVQPNLNPAGVGNVPRPQVWPGGTMNWLNGH